ncbi:MAG: hypothetical protein QOJ64_1012 [Acidobacteriota bacterium]|nr:hypothetical protein [Acidobacteriota bacterium]
MLAKVYLVVLISSALLGLSPHAIRVFRTSNESEYSRRLRLRLKSLVREGLHLVIGVVALILFNQGIVSELAVLVVGGLLVILIEYGLALLIKPRQDENA